ncbi:hypothetical protein JCM8547_003065 [Rhodosporidiobolus lusitaniae]
MVWVVEGTLNNQANDAPDTLPPASSHHLRPGRTYKVGRMGGVRAPPKPGAKQGPASRPRPYDFRLASLSISKEGFCTFETGVSWDPEDHPELPTNGKPYSLTVHVNKKLRLTRASGESQDCSAVTGNNVVTVQDGDHFHEASKNYWFRFRWVPMNFSFALLTPANKKNYLEIAKSLGFKIAIKEFHSHHTHYVAKTGIPSALVLKAAMCTAHVVSPAFFTAFADAGRALDRPSEPIDSPPVAPSAGASKEDQAAYDKALTAWEKNLLALNPDVGADWEKWWGHSYLETNWEASKPDERDYPTAPALDYGIQDAKNWAPDDKRKSLFDGCLVVSFLGVASQEEADGELVRAGSGAYFSCNLLQQDPPPSTSDIIAAIDEFKTEHAFNSARKIVIVAPKGSLEDGPKDDTTVKQLELLRDLQAVLRVGKLCVDDEFAQSIYSISIDNLFGTDIPALPAGCRTQDRESGGSSHRRTQRTTQWTQGTLPFPTGGVPGTHPEDDQPAPTASMDVDGASGSAANSQEDSAPSQPRKLTRRARTNRSVFDDMFDDDHASSSAARSSRPLTQDMDGRTVASTEAGPSSARIDLEQSTPANPPPPTRGTNLKRRAGQRDPLALMFDDDSPERGGSSGTQTQSTHQSLMRTKKTRQERMAAIEEEDQRLAKEEAEQSQAAPKGKGKGRATDDEEGATSSKTKKRGKSVTIGSGGSSDDGQPARKRSTKKEGAAPVSTTNKRTRAASRDPTAGPSSSDDESARTARKKSKAPPDSPVQPKNKKEAAALKKAEKEAVEREKAKLLQVKSTKRKGGELDQAFNDDFNALKIVKPVIKSMPKQEKIRMRWHDEDSDTERREALIREDQERLAHEEQDDMDHENWRRPTQAMFVLKDLEIERKPRAPPRTDVVNERWAGRANFKKFRPKNAQGHREPLAQRPQIVLVVPEAQDYGLGAGYNDRKGTGFSQVQVADDEDDEEDLLRDMAGGGQTKISFSAKAKSKAKAPAKNATSTSKAKGKGKSKQVVVDSEDEDQLDSDNDYRLSNTVRQDNMDLDDDSGTPPARKPSSAAAKSKSRVPRKAAPATILIDDSDSDSDSGLTFKGFGKKGASGRARR